MPDQWRNAIPATAVTVETEDGPVDLQTYLEGLDARVVAVEEAE